MQFFPHLVSLLALPVLDAIFQAHRLALVLPPLDFRQQEFVPAIDADRASPRPGDYILWAESAPSLYGWARASQGIASPMDGALDWQVGGETFVIDTGGISDRTWVDRMGHPHSDGLHLVELFRRVSSDRLDLDMTIEDPKAHTKTWTAQRTFRLRPAASRMGEAICEDMFINEAFGLKPIVPSMK